MPGKFPIANYRQVIKVAKKLGFCFSRQSKGSHETWRRDSDKRYFTISNHGSKPLKRKTLKSILNSFGISSEEFKKLLKK